MSFKPKYKMSVEDNIFWAKRNIVDSIWKEANLEGINITFPDTQAIYDGINVAEFSLREIEKIVNLKHAWWYVFAHIKGEFNLDFLNGLHAEIARGEALVWGALRTGNVSISGTTYKPDIPQEAGVLLKLKELEQMENPTERALEVLAWCCRSQLYWDGNKRVAQLAANKILIENGCGILAIDTANKDARAEFSKLLTDFYETNDSAKLKRYLYENSLDGTSFNA